MKYYLVKKTSTANENNSNFKGEVRTFYIGKGYVNDRKPSPYWTKENGWTRKHFAEKFVNGEKLFDELQTKKYWEDEFEILEFEF